MLQLGQGAPAEVHYEAAIRLNPAYAPQMYLDLGNALAQRGRFTDAIAEYEEAVRRDPGNADAHYNLGSALQQVGRREEGAEQHREAVRLKPELGHVSQ